jgi:AcrR family transcriptional regulator
MTAPSRARQRRRPEDAEREILDAAEALLREGSYADLTVANVMARTGLARSSFYVYFADVPALLRRLASRIEGEFLEVSDVWLTGPGDEDASRRSTAGIVAVYVRHGPVLKALADAAATQPEVEEIFRWGVVQHFIEAVAARCEEQYAAGRFPHLLPREVCHALVLMTERYLADTLGRNPGADPTAVAAALNVVWSKVLYGRDPLPEPLPVPGSPRSA